MKRILMILFVATALVGCAHGSKTKPESNIKITDSLSGNKYSNLYFSGQPSGKAIKELKDKGFVAVINLRNKTEGKYQEFWEEGAVKNQEMAYYNLPYSMKDSLTDEYVDSVTEAVVRHRKEGKILVHCGSGNRVALWLGAHFKKDHGYSNEKSIEVAKQLGMSSQKVESKLRAYLNK